MIKITADLYLAAAAIRSVAASGLKVYLRTFDGEEIIVLPDPGQTPRAKMLELVGLIATKPRGK